MSPLSTRDGPWAKVIKSFATLSIYKTLIPKYDRQAEIHYVFDKEEDYILFQGIATFPSTQRKPKKITKLILWCNIVVILSSDIITSYGMNVLVSFHLDKLLYCTIRLSARANHCNVNLWIILEHVWYIVMIIT